MGNCQTYITFWVGKISFIRMPVPGILLIRFCKANKTFLSPLYRNFSEAKNRCMKEIILEKHDRNLKLNICFKEFLRVFGTIFSQFTGFKF